MDEMDRLPVPVLGVGSLTWRGNGRDPWLTTSLREVVGNNRSNRDPMAGERGEDQKIGEEQIRVHMQVTRTGHESDFDGNSYANGFVYWLKRVDKMLAFKKCTEHRVVTLVETKLTGYPLNWWENIQQLQGYAGGDEAKMLQRHFLGTPSKVGIGANRYATATRFLERYGYVDFRVGACFEGLFLRHEVEIACNADNIGVVILDDGMQHLSLSRDLEIVMVNAIMLWGNSQLLPLGPLREPLAALERADVVVIHHADLVPNGELKLIELKIQQLKETLPIIFHSRLVPSYFFEAKNKCSKLPLSVMHNMAVLCVSAIGSANAFMQVIQKMGQLYTDRMDFSDHHSFQAKDIEMIRGKLRELQSNFDAKPIVVVTEKDYDRNPIILKELDPFEVLVLCSHLQIIPSIGRTEDSFMRVLKHFLELKFS
ncbi:hypothetical protein GIB67_011582 [Kingdonia uniflora]|uniref:tetraacyldisaccharide 4'-kinase n=1 Tax=Kingdonia uniflora TaxID=39325 RepID=A0A7J7NLX8_9MAGN|nr:hypothetical protein GIB67_011582 [Kingdonia uniflora]